MNNQVRRIIAQCLGALWILDGLLQFQPLMFGQSFVTNVLQVNLANQPAFASNIINWGIWLWNINPAASDALAGLLQIEIGILLLFPLSSKIFKTGAWISIFWGAVVWACGEGFGNLLTGSASFYTGAPGAVLIYVLIAVLLLLPEIKTSWYPRIAGWLCLFGGALQLQPQLWGVEGVQNNFMVSMMDPMHPISVLPNNLYNAVGLSPTLSNILLIAVLFIIGFALILRPNWIIGIVAVVFLLFVWWFGQDFGQLSTLFAGTATDPNTAPLIGLLLIPIFVPDEPKVYK